MIFGRRIGSAVAFLLLGLLSCTSVPSPPRPVAASPGQDVAASPADVVSPATGPAPACRMPISGILPGSGGFVQMPGGTFTPDPTSNIPIPGQVDQAGLRRGFTYDPVHLKWLPVPRDWVMPDFSSYVYVGNEFVIGNQPGLHWVDVASGKDTLWPHGEDIYGFPTALRPEGVYGAPGPEIFVMVDPTGLKTTLDQGRFGLFEVITSRAFYATSWSTTNGKYVLSDVYRVDAQTGAATVWFREPGLTVLPIGTDSAGSPIIAAGTQNARTGRIVATQIWIASARSTGDRPQDRLIYSDSSNPLTIQGPPIVSAGSLWFETDQGLYVFTDGRGGFRLASSVTGYISGGCA